MSLSAFLETVHKADFPVLQIREEPVVELSTLPLHHRDPFDRMLIAQAKAEGMHVLTVDPQFGAYGVQLAG